MDLNKITEEVLLLSNMNEVYLEQLKSINSGMTIDDINDDITLNKNDIVVSADDVKKYISKASQAKALGKKIADNIATINSLMAKAKLPDGYFDDSRWLAQYRAKYISAAIPDVAQKNTTINLLVTFKNVGFIPWKKSDNVCLHTEITGPSSTVFSIDTQLTDADIINVGDNKTFTYTIPTPSITEQYTLTISMRKSTAPFEFVITKLIHII